MFHHVARSRDEALLFATWAEAVRLWEAVSTRSVGLQALCLMPDHLHLLAARPQRASLGRGLQAYAQWRNHRRGDLGPLFERQPDPIEVLGEKKRWRSLRYVHLNPCRAGLVDDPLAWPFSTHRDAVGLALRPVVNRQAQPLRFHEYVSSDPTVRVDGSDVPVALGVGLDGPEGVERVLEAVSALARVPREELGRRTWSRSLSIRASRSLVSAGQAEIAEAIGVHRRTVIRHDDALPMVVLKQIERVVGDLRFAALREEHLPKTPGWHRYRWRR